MAERDPFGNLRRSKEEEYFHKKERELIEKVRQRARLGEAAGVEDTTILGHLEALGFDRDTVGLLHLVPLVQVAWSDGEVSAAERKEIHDAAAVRGVAAGSPARAKLDGWLSKRPETAFFERSLAVIGAVLETLPEEKRAAMKGNLVAHCEAVAAASRGILGLGAEVSAAEKKALDHVAGELSRTHEKAARDASGG